MLLAISAGIPFTEGIAFTSGIAFTGTQPPFQGIVFGGHEDELLPVALVCCARAIGDISVRVEPKDIRNIAMVFIFI
jgi:hypothetical protein